VEWYASTVLTMASLGDVVQRGLGDGHDMMDSTLSNDMATSIAVWHGLYGFLP
jgi:hypothetical protein